MLSRNSAIDLFDYLCLPFEIGYNLIQSLDVLPDLWTIVMPQQFTLPYPAAYSKYIGALYAFRFSVEDAVAFPLVTVPERFDLAAVFVSDLSHEIEDCIG